ncbi:hypothetical protein AS200_29650 [Streptomyces sp. CdTB01]|nr:hypothetical protein AS200_29650 [Streptomyces sp. CdTB01]
MPGARLSAHARERTALSALIVSLAEALEAAEDIDLDGVEVLTGLLTQYVALLGVQRERKAGST